MTHEMVLERAGSLARFARHCGVPVTEFELVLTKAEAYVVLEWIPMSGMVSEEGMGVLQEDILEARRRDDPWLVLQHFTFNGMRASRASELQ
jgi:hypothetical protein